jgi:hypothetical protein
MMSGATTSISSAATSIVGDRGAAARSWTWLSWSSNSLVDVGVRPVMALPLKPQPGSGMKRIIFMRLRAAADRAGVTDQQGSKCPRGARKLRARPCRRTPRSGSPPCTRSRSSRL